GDELRDLRARHVDSREHSLIDPVIQFLRQHGIFQRIVGKRCNRFLQLATGELRVFREQRVIPELALDVGPDGADEFARRCIREQLLLQRLRPRDGLWRRLQTLDEIAHCVVELEPQWMIWIGAYLRQRPADSTHYAIRNASVHDVGYPPGRLLLNLLANERVVRFRRACSEAKRFIQQLLVAPIRGEQSQGATEQRRNLNAAQTVAGGTLQERLHILIAQDVRCGSECVRGGARYGAGVRRLRQPLRRAVAQPERGELARDHVFVQKILLDEISERATDPILSCRYDGGVRNWNTERMPKQGRHGKPVRHPTDHRRLGGCSHVAEPYPAVTPLHDESDDKDDARGKEQQQRKTLHADQAVAFERFIGDRRRRDDQSGLRFPDRWRVVHRHR